MRCRSSIFGLWLAVGPRVCFIVRIIGRMGFAVPRYNVALGERFEARSYHVVLREQSSTLVDSRHELRHPHLLGFAISITDNEHQASNR